LPIRRTRDTAPPSLGADDDDDETNTVSAKERKGKERNPWGQSPSFAYTMPPVVFFEAPRQYIAWAVRAKPAIFWSMVIGTIGPVMAV